MPNYGRIEKRALNGSVTIAPGATGTLLTILIPAQVVLRLKDFSNYLSNLMAWGSVTWSMNINGRPLPPYDTLLDQMGSLGLRSPIEEIELTAGIFTITAVNGFAVALAAGASLGFEFVYQE